jgi:hypothetical protein
MSIKARAAQGDKTITPAQRARVDADPFDQPTRLAANQPRLTKLS